MKTYSKINIEVRTFEDWAKKYTQDKDQLVIHHLKDGTLGVLNLRNNMIYILISKEEMKNAESETTDKKI